MYVAPSGTALKEKCKKSTQAMTDEIATPPQAGSALSAFHEAAADTDQHIVDVLIEERCPKLRSSWSWPLIRPALYQVLGYGKARPTRSSSSMAANPSTCCPASWHSTSLSMPSTACRRRGA